MREEIAVWLSKNLSASLSESALEPILQSLREKGTDIKEEELVDIRNNTKKNIEDVLNNSTDKLKDLPRIGELIEFSRSVHAEMNAIINAGLNGALTKGATLFSTTYPCHNCARHILVSGIRAVKFIEPYVKSLSLELHSDAIKNSESEPGDKMVISPFTGVGPRMYEDYFLERGGLKDDDTGVYSRPTIDDHMLGVRLLELRTVEEAASKLVE